MRTYLVLNSAGFFLFGLAGLLFPAAFSRVIGLDASAPALADFSAMYGGLSVALALLLLRGALRPEDARSAVLLTVACGAGLLTGRLLGVARFGGLEHWFIAASATAEATLVVLGVWLLRGRREALA